MKTTLSRFFRAILLAMAVSAHPWPAPAVDPSSASPSEMLENGIYTEETKGDLDAAIAIYEKVVGAAKTSQSLGAQAQFRLAQCYLKKNRAADATAAFEKLIKDFPNEKELIAKAHEHLPSSLALLPVPWADGERLQLNMKLAGGLDIGTIQYYADLAEADGRKVWRVGARTLAGFKSYSMVNADFETFRPISSRWKVPLLGDVTAHYTSGEVNLHREGDADARNVKLDEAVFDNEEAMDVMRRLPLKMGYKTILPVFSTLGAAAPILLGLEVLGEEDIETPAGKFRCWKTKLNIGQTFWFSNDPQRYLVKFEAGGAVALLASISRSQPGQAIEYRDTALGVSLTAPPNWVFYQPKIRVDAKSQLLNMIDPEADSGAAALTITPTENLSNEERASSRAWAELDFRDRISKRLKDARIRPESWKDREVSGRPAASFIADFTENGKPWMAFALYALGPQTAGRFELTCPPAKFAQLLPAFESIIGSCQITK